MLLKILLGLTVLAEIAAVPVFLKYYWPGRSKKSFIWKIISASLFVLCGFLCVKISGNNTPYASLMMWGLVLGFFGDVFLHSLQNKSWHFVVGFLSFLVGHIVYIVAFWKAIKTTYPGSPVFTWYELLATFVLLAVMLAIMLKMKIFEGKKPLLIAFCAYGFILFTMLTKGLRYAVGEIAYGTNDNMIPILLTVGLGAVLFTVSDIILGFTIPMGETSRAVRCVNIGTYFVAQILFAISILFVFSAYPLYP
ncbi:MAG: lysoplasmalogenase [Clostridia bacterium]|nr:lysoplasmalogenase [Clostridia bacterium]